MVGTACLGILGSSAALIPCFGGCALVTPFALVLRGIKSAAPPKWPTHLRVSLHSGLLRCLNPRHSCFGASILLRKEVIQPHLPIRLPCYDFTPVINPTFGSALLTVRLLTSGVTDSHGVTGGVYKARERIHRGMLIRDY